MMYSLERKLGNDAKKFPKSHVELLENNNYECGNISEILTSIFNEVAVDQYRFDIKLGMCEKPKCE